MGLIQAAKGSAGGILGDQWKEYFYCDSLGTDMLMVKGRKRTSRRSSNTRGTDNIISDGSVIAVADGQCALIVEQGRVLEMCAEPGEYVFDSATEPTVFEGDLGESVEEVFRNLGKRFAFGGDAANDQRIYYINTKEILGNKYGTPGPVPFRVVDENIGLDMDISIRCFGEYSYRITNPLLFYTNVCGNVAGNYHRSEIDAQLKSELLTSLQPAFAKVSAMGVRYSALPGHTQELADSMNQVLSARWKDLRGVEIVSMGVSSVKASEEDEAMIKELQRSAVYRNPDMAAAKMVDAQAEAMKSAASNQGGAMMGFMGMNMAQQAGGINAGELFRMSSRQSASGEGWTCSCGTRSTGKFCPECGSKKPQGWKCACGSVNKGRFCTECGSPKPAAEPQYRCDKCGWEPEDAASAPKFCPECGDVFNGDDLK